MTLILRRPLILIFKVIIKYRSIFYFTIQVLYIILKKYYLLDSQIYHFTIF